MVNENPIPYRLIRSDRKSIGIQITADGVIVRAPKRLSAAEIDRFVQSKRSWIEAHLSKIPARRKKEAGYTNLRFCDRIKKKEGSSWGFIFEEAYMSAVDSESI